MMRSPGGGRPHLALAAVLALAACADTGSGPVFVPLDALEPGAGPVELGAGVADAPRAIMSAVIAGDLLVGGQAAARMGAAPAFEPAAGPESAPEQDEAQHEERVRQADQALLLEHWMGTRVAQPTLSSREIRRAQELLTELGYDPGPIDGIVGARTRAAVLSFRQSQGLPALGEVTPALIDRLALEI